VVGAVAVRVLLQVLLVVAVHFRKQFNEAVSAAYAAGGDLGVSPSIDLRRRAKGANGVKPGPMARARPTFTYDIRHD